ncbi:MAG TPA: response regulator transcription factor [Saprospiraceae bacterium]|nr:response regulator transcription factor [Saprospiraceae bacterium]
MSSIKTVILDKHLLFAEALAELLKGQAQLDLSISGIYNSASKFKLGLRNGKVDLLIMELALSDGDGLQLIPEIRKTFDDLKILVVSSYTDSRFVKKALQSGADGYMAKSNSLSELITALESIIADRTYIGNGLHITPPSGSLQRNEGSIDIVNGTYKDKFLIRKRLTKREQEILHLIIQAKNNKEIASELYISDQTVGVHRKNIMRKLGVKNTINLIKFAIEHELV